MTDKTQPAEGMRRCIGSERYGIEAHDAPSADFPAQPSQRDGLGRMCRPHWSQYTAGLARDAKARKAQPEVVTDSDARATAAKKAKRASGPATQSPKSKPTKKGPAAKVATKRSARVAAQEAVDAAHNARIKAEGTASTPDFEAAAEQDAILADRKARVKAMRKAELESPKLPAGVAKAMAEAGLDA